MRDIPVRQRSNPKHVLAAVGGIAIVMLVITAMVALAYFLTDLLYARTDIVLPALAVQLINALLGLFFSFFAFSLASIIFRRQARRLQFAVFENIIDAMNRIARGDFSVRIENEFKDNEPVSALVQSVNTMAQELNQMEALRQEFISNVSHEIQSPLTSIRGFARALQNEELSTEQRTHYLNIIETESMRLSKLSDNLLALAALDAENHTLEPQAYALDKQIREVILACEPQWAEKQIEMQLAAEPVTIQADADLLYQVWMNLIYNSIKFTPPRGKISIELHPRAEQIEFRIADTGIGMSMQDREHVFERFFKADKSRERAKGGSGLGLAIAKRIVEMHHGTIAVQSELGVGTTFTVMLPREFHNGAAI